MKVFIWTTQIVFIIQYCSSIFKSRDTKRRLEWTSEERTDEIVNFLNNLHIEPGINSLSAEAESNSMLRLRWQRSMVVFIGGRVCWILVQCGFVG